MFKPTCDCNLNCTYCYDRPQRERFKGQKASQVILEHTAKLMSEYADEVQWYWHGGEPLLMGKEYYYLAQEVFARNYKSNFEQALQSNGILHLKDPDWLSVMKDCNIGMGFSFDLFGQSTRLGNNVDITEDFENMLENFKENGGRDNIEAVTVITTKTISRLIDTYEHFKKRFGGDYVMSLLLVFEIDETSPTGLGISELEYIQYYPAYLTHVLHDVSDNCLLDRYIYSYLMKLIGDPNTDLCGFIECREKWISVHPDGTVTHCDREPGKYYNLGNIMDYNSIGEIYQSSMYRKFNSDCEERLDNFCRKCDFYTYCNGGCHSNHGAVNNTRVNLVNKRECYTIQHNLISIYAMLQSITDTNYNPKLKALLTSHDVKLPHTIHEFLKKQELHYARHLDITSCRNNTSDFVHSKQFRLFELFNKQQMSLEDILKNNLRKIKEIIKEGTS